MFEVLSSRQYARMLKEAKDTSTRKIVMAMNRVGESWLEEIQVREPQKSGELVNHFKLRRATGADLSIAIVNKLPYADHIEDGFFQTKRWVPGHWEGDTFVYTPGEKTGMMLDDRWVPGNHIVRTSRERAHNALAKELHNIIFGNR